MGIYPHTLTVSMLMLLILGDEPTEATASLKYNRNRNTVVADIVIPDYDIEAGIKLSITDSEGKKMHGIVVDVTNRNIPQLTLVGHTRFYTHIFRLSRD